MEEFKLRRRKLPGPFPENLTAKWSRVVLDEGYVPFPKRLLRTLSGIFKGAHASEDLAVVLSIVDYQRPKLIRPPSIKYLAWNAGLSQEVFLSRAAALEERGLFVRGGSDDEATFDLRPLEAVIVELTPPEEGDD